MQNVNECLNIFNAKYNALRDLIEVMIEHNLTFESSLVDDKIEIRIVQDFFKDGDPIIIFSKNDGKKSSIDCVDISRS